MSDVTTVRMNYLNLIQDITKNMKVQIIYLFQDIMKNMKEHDRPGSCADDKRYKILDESPTTIG